MAKKEDDGKVVKAYKFKAYVLPGGTIPGLDTDACGGRPSSKDFIEHIKKCAAEQQDYRDKLSGNFNQMLVTKKIGDLAGYIKNHDAKYYQRCEVTAEWPLYKVFTKKFGDSNTRMNTIYEYVRNMNPENYGSNIMNFTETSYRRFGYIKNLVANYVTKMSSLRPNVKYRKIGENPDEKTLSEQCIYEMFNHTIVSKEDFKSFVDYVKDRSESESRVQRIETLYDYYKSHEAEMNEAYVKAGVESLTSFNGVKTDRNSVYMTVYMNDSTLSIERGKGCSYIMHVTLNKGKTKFDLRLLGNRQVIRQTKDGIEEFVDICGNHGENVTFQVKGGDLYVILTSKNDFSKISRPIENVVGCDVNTKHSMLSTSIVDDGKVSGYINIYKHLCEDKEFMSNITEDMRTYYREMARTVNICPIESDLLFARYCNSQNITEYDQKLTIADNAFTRVLMELKEKYAGNKRIVDYLEYVRKLRSRIKSYFVLKQMYHDMQSRFDEEQGYKDESTESKETMDKRRFESPFASTPAAIKKTTEMENVERQIIGCRNNIIWYAYDMFINNGYDTLSLEYLESSQFERIRFTSPKSLLNFHKAKGQTLDELRGRNNIKKFTYDDYVYDVDDNGAITDIKYSEKGRVKELKGRFCNNLMKIIHFAEVKDYFTTLANDSRMNIIMSPSFFSSQMDSKTHTIYAYKGKDKKTKIARKDMVRKTQERHINGLNADYNAACNLAYIASNETMRNEFCIQTKNGYNEPLYKSSVKRPDAFLTKLKKNGLLSMIS